MELKRKNNDYIADIVFPYMPRCPRCGRANDIRKIIVSKYHRCQFCGKQLRTDKLYFEIMLRKAINDLGGKQ